MGVSTDWCVTVKHWKLSSIRIIFIDSQTSELQYNYQSYIQVYTIEDTWGFSSIAPITPSRDFNGETLIDMKTLSQKTELDRSISVMEDRISELLYYHYKGMLQEEWPLWKVGFIQQMLRRQYHCRDIYSKW